MIKPWIFEFMYAPETSAEALDPQEISGAYAEGFRIWERAEELGFEGIFFSEHHFSLSYSPSPNLLIAALAQRTRRLRLGVMGVVVPFYEPWRIGEEICMLDHLTGGRLEVGIAAGIPQELSRVGYDPAEARERFNEAVGIVETALAEPVFSHHGKFWNFERLSTLPRPLQQPSPPVWTTVVSDRSARLCAQRGSRICTGFESAARIKEIFDSYRDEAQRSGTVASAEHLAIRRNVSIGESESEAREAAETALAVARRVMAGDTRLKEQRSEILDAPKAGAGFSVHEDEFIAGTPQQVAEQIIEQFRLTGAGHFLGTIGRGLGDRRYKAVELFGSKVVPLLKRAATGEAARIQI